MTIKFKFLTGDINWQEYGGKFISKKLNNGDFDYWLILSVDNLHECMDENHPNKYLVSVNAIAPSELPEKEIESALQSMGQEDLSPAEFTKKYGMLGLLEAISGYMGGAMIFYDEGNNLRKLMKNAREQAEEMGVFLFGFAMDRTMNRIGSTGWDILRGDITAGLYR